MNRCRCKLCGDIIISKHRHDFVRCSCGEIFTDGGDDYIRRGAAHMENIIDMPEGTEYNEELHGILRKIEESEDGN